MVRALPKTMEPKARIEPSASVETPVTPWPMVQPMESTPPTPMSTPPATWLAKSAPEANHSMRNLFAKIAYRNEPTITPVRAITPKLT